MHRRAPQNSASFREGEQDCNSVDTLSMNCDKFIDKLHYIFIAALNRIQETELNSPTPKTRLQQNDGVVLGCGGMLGPFGLWTVVFEVLFLEALFDFSLKRRCCS